MAPAARQAAEELEIKGRDVCQERRRRGSGRSFRRPTTRPPGARLRSHARCPARGRSAMN